jgi:hypothetical protein
MDNIKQKQAQADAPLVPSRPSNTKKRTRWRDVGGDPIVGRDGGEPASSSHLKDAHQWALQLTT